MLSWAFRAASEAEMFQAPPVSFRSSLVRMPSLEEMTVTVPRPFSTRSSREKITASSSPLNTPLTVREFSLPSAEVRKTLSAFSTRIQGLSAFTMLRPSSTSCTLSSSPASTTTWASNRARTLS